MRWLERALARRRERIEREEQRRALLNEATALALCIRRQRRWLQEVPTEWSQRFDEIVSELEELR